MGRTRDGKPCPVLRLVPERSAWLTGDILAAARSAIAADASRRDEIGQTLLHVLLEHMFEARPQVAKAIVELTPAVAPTAADGVRRFLADRLRDPTVTRDPYGFGPKQYSASEPIIYRTTLALLEGSGADEIRTLFAAAEDADALEAADGYRLLGPVFADEVAVRLAAMVRDGKPSGNAVQVLMEIGPSAYPLLREALHHRADSGGAVGSIFPRLASVDAGFRSDAAALALRSLPLAAGDHIRRRHETDYDRVEDILACGEEFRAPVTMVLESIARNTGSGPEIRWRAVHRLAAIDPDAFAREAAALVAEGVEDSSESPKPPVLTGDEREQVRAAVSEAWQRIHAGLAERHPDSRIRFGPPATDDEIAEVEAKLGFAFPPDFAASLAIHREVETDDYVDGLPRQFDLAALAEIRDGQDGGWQSDDPDTEIRMDHGWRVGWIPLAYDADGSVHALDLDPAAAGRYGQVIYLDQGNPDHVEASSWLELLQRFAEALQGS